MQTHNITIETQYGNAESEITRNGLSHNAIIILPTGGEMEVHVETECTAEAIQVVEDAITFWVEESGSDCPDLDPINCPF